MGGREGGREEGREGGVSVIVLLVALPGQPGDTLHQVCARTPPELV